MSVTRKGSLRDEVFNSTLNELERAKARYGESFNSPHEAYGVMAEELSEAAVDGNRVIELFGNLYDSGMIERLHNDDLDGQAELYKSIEEYAEMAATEFIQIAAVARKALGCRFFAGYWKNGKEEDAE